MIRTRQDLQGMRTVGDVVAQVLRSLESIARPGVTTQEIDEKAASLFDQFGVISAPRHFYDFPGSICISVNDEAVHGVPGSRVLESGDLLKIDVTVMKDEFIADAARTVFVGMPSPEARRLRDCAMRAFEAALDVIRAGNRVNEIGRAIERVVHEEHFHVLRELTGHGIGATLHESPKIHNYYVPTYGEILEEGMVLAVEPVISTSTHDIYTAEDSWTIKTLDGSMAAHHEQTLIVTKGHPTIVTRG